MTSERCYDCFPKTNHFPLHPCHYRIMHLEPCPMRSELRLVVFQQGAERWSCSTVSTNVANEAPPYLKTQKPFPLDTGSSVKDDAAAVLDIWSVIRPGYVRERIAIFASDGRWSSSSGVEDAKCTAAPPIKTKRSWKEESAAKRSCWFTNRQTHLQPLRSDPLTLPQKEDEENERAKGDEQELKVSVAEMVAFLEQRLREERKHQQHPPPAVQGSCTSITLLRAPPPEAMRRAGPGGARVSDLVARLECLQGIGKGDGPGVVTGRFRRAVRRLLLTPHSSAPLPPPGPTAAPPTTREEEPLPGLLFRPTPLASATPSLLSTPTQHPSPSNEEPLPGLLFQSPPLPDPAPQPSPSPDFLQTRQQLQRLLEPAPSYLSQLPAHLLLQILRLLPTRSLAALKCCCRHFRRLIDAYGVRPADSLWVRDPRYRLDPCKRCRRRWRGIGDVSLCRWHHKAFWQAAPPHGPAYWLCCHAPRRDAPGCNVGLHDNRWVPSSCHGCRRGQQDH